MPEKAKKVEKGEGIDLAALKDESSGEFVSRPILFCKQPDDKNNFYGYRAKFIEEPRQFTSKKGNTYDCVDALLVEVTNDEEVEVGKEYTIVLPHVLKKKLLKLGQGSITGKTFDFAGRGKRKPKKAGGREYYDFGVMLKEGTLAWSMLTRTLPIRDEAFETTPEENFEEFVL